VLDECHKAKNLMTDSGTTTVTGVAVKHLQDSLPEAAVLYSSATGMSEPLNMAYMTRLGTFGHACMEELIGSLIKCGLGASELFSCSLKACGVYLARCATAAPTPHCPAPLRQHLHAYTPALLRWSPSTRQQAQVLGN
jgi:P-loop containing NTP hydrolase pore-1